MEKDAEKDLKEGKENITEFARRMRELAGLSEGNHNKSLKTIQEGKSSFEDGATFYAKDMANMATKEEVVSESEEVVKEAEEFDTHKFEQKTIEEGEEDETLYTLNENTIIVLDFLDEEEEK